jgi:hypothetical protein
VDLGEDTHHTTFAHLSCPFDFLFARAATAMVRGGSKTKAGKGEGVVADRTRHNGNKRGIAALQSKFVPPAQAKAKTGVGLPKPGFDSGSSPGAKEGQARSSPSPSKKEKKRQSKSPVIGAAEAMKELFSTTKLFSSPSKQKEFQRKVKGILSGRDKFSPASSVESTPTASPAAPMMPKKHQQGGGDHLTCGKHCLPWGTNPRLLMLLRWMSWQCS